MKALKNIMLCSFYILVVSMLGLSLQTDVKGATEDFTYEAVSGGVKITRYLKNGVINVVKIPNIIDGKTVVEIGDNAFRDCFYVTSVAIPDGVKIIGDYAFFNCQDLTSIEIPESVTSIGDYAFHSCQKVTSITIPSEVTNIGNGAFFGCGGIKNITIPAGVTSIGEEAFYYCTGLTTITIPNTVTSIGDKAFYYCYSLESVDIPDRVTSIGCEAFWTCYGLTTVKIGDSVTSIGNNAFERCRNLSSVEIGDSVTEIGDSAFISCDGLTTVKIPDKVTSIGNSTFEGCWRLSSVEIPKSVESIGKNAFKGTKVNIPPPIIEEEGYLKYWCNDELKKFTGNLNDGPSETIKLNKIFKFRIVDNKVVIEEFLQKSFYGNFEIPNEVNGKPVVKIGYAAFYYCCLEDVTIPSSVTEIDKSAFCFSRLTRVTIPESVTSIGADAFKFTEVDTPPPTYTKDGYETYWYYKDPNDDSKKIKFTGNLNTGPQQTIYSDFAKVLTLNKYWDDKNSTARQTPEFTIKRKKTESANWEDLTKDTDYTQSELLSKSANTGGYDCVIYTFTIPDYKYDDEHEYIFGVEEKSMPGYVAKSGTPK